MNPAISFHQIALRLRQLDDWQDRYRYILQLGQALPDLGNTEKIAGNRVDGCASQVWLVPDAEQRNGQIILSYRGGSDAKIVQGLVAIVLALYSGRTAAEILSTDASAIFDGLGLREHLTMQRANGMVAMVSRIRADAQAYAKLYVRFVP